MKSLKISFPTLFALLICSCLSLCSYAEDSQTHESNENTELVYTESGDSENEELSFFSKIKNVFWTVVEFIWDIIWWIFGAIVLIVTLCFVANL